MGGMLTSGVDVIIVLGSIDGADEDDLLPLSLDIQVTADVGPIGAAKPKGGDQSPSIPRFATDKTTAVTVIDSTSAQTSMKVCVRPIRGTVRHRNRGVQHDQGRGWRSPLRLLHERSGAEVLHFRHGGAAVHDDGSCSARCSLPPSHTGNFSGYMVITADFNKADAGVFVSDFAGFTTAVCCHSKRRDPLGPGSDPCREGAMRPFPVVFLPDAGAVEQETSMNRFVSVCSMALALGVGMAAVSRAESRAVQSDPAPGGVLRSRATAYWRLLAAGDRDGASRFLRPEDRPYFLEHPEPPFQDPEVQGIEPSADGTRAVARIGFNMLTPFGPFRWEIRQAWTCVGGEWVAEPRRSTGNPFQSRPATEEEPPPADTGCRP